MVGTEGGKCKHFSNKVENEGRERKQPEREKLKPQESVSRLRETCIWYIVALNLMAP